MNTTTHINTALDKSKELQFLSKLYAPCRNDEADKMDAAITAILRKYSPGNLQDLWIEVDAYLSAYCRYRRDIYERAFLNMAWTIAKGREGNGMKSEISTWEEKEYGRDREDYFPPEDDEALCDSEDC